MLVLEGTPITARSQGHTLRPWFKCQIIELNSCFTHVRISETYQMIQGNPMKSGIDCMIIMMISYLQGLES